MEPTNLRLRRILDDFKEGKVSGSEAENLLSSLFPTDVETTNAVIDVNREKRTGFPEAIYAASKTPGQVVEIFKKMMEASGKALATRCNDEALDLLEKKFPDATIDRLSRIALQRSDVQLHPNTSVAILAAGTSDLPVAEEAALTLEFSGYQVERVFDVGVAGIHRLFGRMDKLKKPALLLLMPNGRGSAKRCWRSGFLPGDCCSNFCWLRCEFWRCFCITWYA